MSGKDSAGISRRKFLKTAAVGAGAVAMAGGVSGIGEAATAPCPRRRCRRLPRPPRGPIFFAVSGRGRKAAISRKSIRVSQEPTLSMPAPFEKGYQLPDILPNIGEVDSDLF